MPRDYACEGGGQAAGLPVDIDPGACTVGNSVIGSLFKEFERKWGRSYRVIDQDADTGYMRVSYEDLGISVTLDHDRIAVFHADLEKGMQGKRVRSVIPYGSGRKAVESLYGVPFRFQDINQEVDDIMFYYYLRPGCCFEVSLSKGAGGADRFGVSHISIGSRNSEDGCGL
jgi:hypothetical protein